MIIDKGNKEMFLAVSRNGPSGDVFIDVSNFI